MSLPMLLCGAQHCVMFPTCVVVTLYSYTCFQWLDIASLAGSRSSIEEDFCSCKQVVLSGLDLVICLLGLSDIKAPCTIVSSG